MTIDDFEPSDLWQMDNTEGYNQEELDFHNGQFIKYLIEKEWDPYGDLADNSLKSYSDRYFNDYMC